MVTWPAALPQDQFLGTTFKRQDVRLRTPTDTGPGKVRRKFTIAAVNVTTPIVVDGAQRQVFDDFYVETLQEGSVPFDWEDPLTDQTVVFQFKPPLPEWQLVKGGSPGVRLWRTMLTLQIVPTNVFVFPPLPEGTGMFISVKDFGAVGNGIANDTTAFQNALATNKTIFIPIGTYLISAQLAVNSDMLGESREMSIIKMTATGINPLRVGSDYVTLSDFTVDLVNGNDAVAGSCFQIVANRVTCRNLRALNANRQGFTGPCSHSIFEGCLAINCGHRGFNFSENCNHNKISDCTAIDCGFSGLLLGFGSSLNTITNLHVSGFSVSPGVVVHMAANYNTFTGVVVSDPTGASEPHLQIGAASHDNIFSNVVLHGVNNRGVLIRNEDLTEPDAADLGLVNGPNARNVLENVQIHGTGAAGSTGIYIDEVAGEAHGMRDHVFSNIYIDDVDVAVRDVTDTATGLQMHNVKLSQIAGSKWDFLTGKGHVVSRYTGISDLGSLATATTELPAHPAYSSGTIVTNNYPFAVQVHVQGQAGTGAGTSIAMDAAQTPVSTLVPAGNGQFILQPGTRIQCTQGSTGAGTWRWFCIG